MAMRRAIFWANISVATVAPMLSLRFWLWLPRLDAPELVVPVLGASIVGAVVFVAALATAWFTRPTSS
jgi:hypothetical protein